tara:strand:+ start:313 stop:1458 length:1146 start_codon:yes stop_codon:yes gene_type:complete
MSSRLIVNSIRHTGGSADAVTLASDGTCTANITNKPNTNILMNGAMLVAQRGTSSTSNGYQTIDRFAVFYGGTDEAPTQAQVDLTSSDTPYSLGFRKALKVTNGNQTSGAGTNDFIEIMQKFEGQDINSSGWDFTSSSSFITISFWIKSSVAQTFYGKMRITEASANKEYTFAVNATTSWQKITKTIPGASGLNPVNTNALGGWFDLIPFFGTAYSGSMTLDQWNTYDASAAVPDMTSTWYTTNDATLEYTGLKMEVGSVATDFEHRSYGQELSLCQRYYIRLTAGGSNALHFTGSTKQQQYVSCARVELPTTMRTAPSISFTGTRDILNYSNDNSGYSGDKIDVNSFNIRWGSSNTIGDGTAYTAALTGDPNYIEVSAEL